MIKNLRSKVFLEFKKKSLSTRLKDNLSRLFFSRIPVPCAFINLEQSTVLRDKSGLRNCVEQTDLRTCLSLNDVGGPNPLWVAVPYVGRWSGVV